MRGRDQDSEFGYALTAAGDQNGDGFPDLWIDDPVHDNRTPGGPRNENRGEVLLVSGSDGAVLRRVSEAFVCMSAIYDYGLALSTLDDLDGDGARELLLGVPDIVDEGRVYVVSSRTGEDLLEINRENEAPAGCAPPEKPR